MDHFCYLCFLFAMPSYLFNAAMWSPAQKGLNFWLSCECFFVCFCHFPVWCPGSGVVRDCINSLSLPPYLLWLISKLIRVFTRHLLHFVLFMHWSYINC